MQVKSEVLAFVFDGKMTSAFKALRQGMKGSLITHVDEESLLFIGSPGLLDDEFMDGSAVMLALNSLDWLSHDEALIALRSRGVTERPLAALSSDGKLVFKLLWLFFLPLLVLLFGLWRWWQLKHPVVNG